MPDPHTPDNNDGDTEFNTLRRQSSRNLTAAKTPRACERARGVGSGGAAAARAEFFELYEQVVVDLRIFNAHYVTAVFVLSRLGRRRRTHAVWARAGRARVQMRGARLTMKKRRSGRRGRTLTCVSAESRACLRYRSSCGRSGPMSCVSATSRWHRSTRWPSRRSSGAARPTQRMMCAICTPRHPTRSDLVGDEHPSSDSRQRGAAARCGAVRCSAVRQCGAVRCGSAVRCAHIASGAPTSSGLWGSQPASSGVRPHL